MDISDIWIGIIIPIVIGPIFVYLKSLRDEIVERKFRRAQEKYIAERDTIFKELKVFYWPVYINLLCIQQYTYSLPIKNRFRYESRTSLEKYNSSESEDFYPNEDTQRVSEYNNRNSSHSINILDEELNNDNVEITIPLNNISVNIDDKEKKTRSIAKKTIILDKSTLKLLEENLNKKFKETASIIEDNIALVCIHQNLNNEIINFIKYAKIREIIHEGSPEQEYNIGYFGVKNNLDLFINEIKTILNKLNLRYSELINNPI